MSKIFETLKSAQQNRTISEKENDLDLSPLKAEVHRKLKRSSVNPSGFVKTVAGLGIVILIASTSFYLYNQFINSSNFQKLLIEAPEAINDDPSLTSVQYQIKSFANMVNSGIASYYKGDLDTSFKTFQEALGTNADSPPLHNNLGVLYLKNGELEKALDSFHKALEIMPDYPEAHFNIAVALESERKYFDALSHYQQFLDTAPSSMNTLKKEVIQHIGS